MYLKISECAGKNKKAAGLFLPAAWSAYYVVLISERCTGRPAPIIPKIKPACFFI
jgi:hypothetical protein